MAITTSKPKTKPKLTYAFSYGLAGGRGHGRKLGKLLQQTGWKPAQQATKADIIIAHSAGCWLIPASAKPKLVVYVGMPLSQAAPGQTWTTARRIAFQKSGIKSSLKTNLQSGYYISRQPRRNWRIVRSAKTAKPIIFPNAQSVFIANHHDPWPQSETLQTYLANQDWAFISLPGIHDDIWEHPQRYATIINHYARLLA